MPLAVPGSDAAPLPGKTISAVPLLEKTIDAVPPLEKTTDTAPLPAEASKAVSLADPVGSATPLVERAITPTPMLDSTAPLVEEQAQMARLEDCTQWATPSSKICDTIPTLPKESDQQKVKVEPARPDSYWIQGEGASGPLPSGADTSTTPEVDFVLQIATPPADTHATSPVPLAVLENTEISPGESPQRPGGSECIPAGRVQSPVKPHTGRPSVAEILQQRVVREQVMVTTTKTKETILQQPLEIEAEPMVISSGNTPMAPDYEELDMEDKQALMMDETHL